MGYVIIGVCSFAAGCIVGTFVATARQLLRTEEDEMEDAENGGIE